MTELLHLLGLCNDSFSHPDLINLLVSTNYSILDTISILWTRIRLIKQ